MKPKINISFDNGIIGAVTPLETGCFGLLSSALTVEDGFQLDTPYQIKSMRDVAQLKIVDSIDNHRLFKTLSEFYAEAGEGTEVWVMGLAKDTKVSDWFTLDQTTGIAPAEKLLNAANGKIRALFTNYHPDSYVESLDKELDVDVYVAANLAQQLADNYTAKKYAPFFVLLEGYAFSGKKEELIDNTEMSFNSVGIIIGDTEKREEISNSHGAAVGVVAGRLASYPIRENMGKVRNGSLSAPKLFIVNEAVENYDTEALYDKGFITFTTHVSKAGYFIMDDPLACEVVDDYHYITHRRTINEAYRLAYQALLDFLLDEVPVNNDGTIVAVYAKTMESAVERLISTQMAGDLSVSDNTDMGVECYVDPNQNIIAHSKLNVVVRVRPFGYNRWIDVLLGFDINQKKQVNV